MAFNEQEKQLIIYGKQNGKSAEEITTAIAKLRAGIVPPPTTPQQRPIGIDVAIGAAKEAGSALKDFQDSIAASVPSLLAGPIASAIPAVKDKINGLVQPLKDLFQKHLGLTDENLKADNDAQRVGKGLAIAAEIAAPFAPATLSRVTSKAAQLPELLRKAIGRDVLLPSVPENAAVEDVVKLADSARNVEATTQKLAAGEASPEALKASTDAAAQPVTFTEKMAGLAPDVKARIKGKGKLLSDYLNIADARNQSDLVPTPLEYAASFTDQAVTKMEQLLNNTGGQIGSFRKKLSSYQAPREAFNFIRNTFDSKLKALNLTIKNGQVEKLPGKIAQTISDTEVNALRALHNDLEIASENPSLENLIDLRNKFTNKIDFDKASRDVSSTLDPLSRAVRKSIADVAANVVGKSQAKALQEFSDLSEAYQTLRSFTDRKAGAEFLLKRVFSERGGDARTIMQTILRHTGIDLMDHAMMAKIATELAGNPAMQGLFRQEVTRAGLDAFNLLKGNPAGAIDTLLQKGIDTALKPRKVFQKAAR